MAAWPLYRSQCLEETELAQRLQLGMPGPVAQHSHPKDVVRMAPRPTKAGDDQAGGRELRHRGGAAGRAGSNCRGRLALESPSLSRLCRACELTTSGSARQSGTAKLLISASGLACSCTQPVLNNLQAKDQPSALSSVSHVQVLGEVHQCGFPQSSTFSS